MLLQSLCNFDATSLQVLLKRSFASREYSQQIAKYCQKDVDNLPNKATMVVVPFSFSFSVVE
jgi:hypothetical protein